LSPDNLTLISLPKLDWATQKAAWFSSCNKPLCISIFPWSSGRSCRLVAVSASPCSNSLQNGKVWISSPIASRAIYLLRIRKYKNWLTASGRQTQL
jgi:hypothetical protein